MLAIIAVLWLAMWKVDKNLIEEYIFSLFVYWLYIYIGRQEYALQTIALFVCCSCTAQVKS